MSRFFLILSLSLVFFSGCDDPLALKTTTLEGHIVNLSSDREPFSGVSISMKISAGSPGSVDGGGMTTIAQTRSDSDGNFIIRGEVAGNTRAEILINDEPYDARFSTAMITIQGGHSLLKEVELFEYTALEVTATTDSITTQNRYCVYLPIFGRCTNKDTSITVVSYWAKGNLFNTYQIAYDRGDSSKILTDSVYCPMGDTTQIFVRF